MRSASLVLLALLWNFPAHAELGCFTRKFRTFEPTQTTRAFWDRKEPLLLKGKNGRDYPLTLSFDSEFDLAEVLKAIQQDSRLLRELEPKLESYSVEDIVSGSEYSVESFRRNALRTGVDRDRKTYKLTDLIPSAYSKGVFANAVKKYPKHFGQLPADNQMSHVTRAFQKVTDALGIPGKVHMDARAVEVSHSSFDTVPSQLESHLKTLHSLAKDPERSPATHLHAGLAADAVSEEKARKIASAIEARLTLGLAGRPPEESGKLTYLWGSSMAGRHSRGVVYLKLNEFKKPVLSHDIEIRQADSVMHLQDQIASVANFASRRKSIIDPPNELGEKEILYLEASMGNIVQSLEYFAVLLRENKVPKWKELEAEALELAEAIAREAPKKSPPPKVGQPERVRVFEMSEALRKRVYRLMQRSKAEELMRDDDFFISSS